MPYRITNVESTPNPNALKCFVDPPISDGPRSFRKREDADGDPIADPIFAIDGVTCVFLNGDWMTVNKSPEASWPSVKKSLERVLGEV